MILYVFTRGAGAAPLPDIFGCFDLRFTHPLGWYPGLAVKRFSRLLVWACLAACKLQYSWRYLLGSRVRTTARAVQEQRFEAGFCKARFRMRNLRALPCG